MKPCRDCLTEAGSVEALAASPQGKRPAPHPGPRCTTHHRVRKVLVKAREHDRRVLAVYGLEPGDYQRLYEAQGGRCAIFTCRAKGKSRMLAVEHDHRCQASHGGQIRRCCVRGLTCAVHNEWIGRSGDNPDVFRSIADYLEHPPAKGIL